MVEIFNFSTIGKKKKKKFEIQKNFIKEVAGTQKNLNWKFFEHFQGNLPKTMFFRSCDFIFNFIALFSKMRRSILTLPVILSFMTFFVAGTFLVELHLDDVIEVLLVVGLSFFTKLVDK